MDKRSLTATLTSKLAVDDKFIASVSIFDAIHYHSFAHRTVGENKTKKQSQYISTAISDLFQKYGTQLRFIQAMQICFKV